MNWVETSGQIGIVDIIERISPNIVKVYCCFD